MLSLIFKLICWQRGCQPSMVLFFIELILILLILLFFLFIFYICEFYFWRKKFNLLLNHQQTYLNETLPLLNSAKISLFSINSIKTPLTSLRLIIDELKDPSLLKNKKLFNQYLLNAESLLLQIKKREELLNKQLLTSQEEKLFDLVDEIRSLLAIYHETILINNIGIEFNSDREYRIFANQDQLLRIINIILLNIIESLILSNKDCKLMKIYLKKSPYQLKIFFEDNLGLIKSQTMTGLLRIDQMNDGQHRHFCLSLFCANQLMKKNFGRKIYIKSTKNKRTVYCLKIKNSYILAEPRIKQQ